MPPASEADRSGQDNDIAHRFWVPGSSLREAPE